MVVYGNNLHEKLFGHAVSKDYLLYATPFCELAEDPDFALDIDLAVDFHAALRGNQSAVTRFVNSLVLNSGELDWSTINFYVDKMLSHPYFKADIDRIQTIFNDPNYPNFKGIDGTAAETNTSADGTGAESGTSADGSDGTVVDGNIRSDSLSPDGGFLRKLRDKANDCVNEPCNIFQITSDSIGRMSQVASTKNSDNVFDVGAIKGACTNIINGMDQTVFNKLPGSFQKGVAEVTVSAKEAWTRTQTAFVGVDNANKLASHIKSTGDARSFKLNNKPLSYTPDVKSFFNLDKTSGSILGDLASELGGCFGKFQHAARYNPYNDNESTPEKPSDLQVNGAPYTTLPGGGWDNAGVTPATMGDCSHLQDEIINVPYGGGEPGSDSFSSSDLPPQASPVQYGVGDPVDNGEVWLSKPIIMGSKSKGSSGYSVFGGFIDRENKKLLVDNYSSKSPGGNSDDDLTMKGVVFVSTMLICPSFWIDPGDSAGGTEKAISGGTLSDKGYIINKLSNGYGHNVTEQGMAVQQDSTTSKIFDDGVALSKPLIQALGAYERLTKDANTWNGRSAKNLAFAVIRRAGECPKIFKIVDYNSQSIHNVDFTPAAYKVMFNKIPPTTPIEQHAPKLAEYGWTAGVASHGDEGDIETRIAFGTYEDVKALVDEELKCGDLEIPENIAPVVMTNQGATRNLPIHPDLQQALSIAGGAIQADKVVVYSGGQKKPRTTGSTRHNVATTPRGTGGMAADFYIIKNGKKLPYTDPQWGTFSKVFVQVTKGMGYKPSGGCGPTYMSGGTSAHFDIAAGYTTSSAAVWINIRSGVPYSTKISTTPWLANFGV